MVVSPNGWMVTTPTFQAEDLSSIPGGVEMLDMHVSLKHRLASKDQGIKIDTSECGKDLCVSM